MKHANGNHANGNHTNGNATNGSRTNGDHADGSHTNGSLTNGIQTNGNLTNGKAKPLAAPIAIIGMRGRFPGANDLDQLWQNFANGVESITTLTPDEMRAAGIPDQISRLPGYVNASPVLDHVDEFDAEFFGFSARDAALTDPQHRVFLETCWEALEDAGYEPGTYAGEIGVFGGCEMSTYLNQLYQNPEALQYIDGMQLMVTNDKDHLCTQVSYRLDLRGPSVVVQTTCSTSLVAVSMACETLRAGRCSIALAGGVTVRVPQRGGYYYTPGSILSPDGHCRPFDAAAQGTIVGSGVGVVVLKPLVAALRDRDSIRAVILGTGINNDGHDKVGYAAPSYRGQAAAIRAAHAMAGVTADSISYVEAHGTGTILGDPIEVSALIDAFTEQTDRRGYCGIGSAKSNFGHLSCAAGVTGLIKTTLMLEHEAIPPTVHYTSPNPAIDFAASPFFVTTTLHPWHRNGTPRRAGVSSFGVGGTNAHLILQEAPERTVPAKRRGQQLIVLSARTETALQAASVRLADHLDAHPDTDLADAANTLQLGRREFPHRRAIVTGVTERASLIASLRQPFADAVVCERDVIFLFPGQGAQYPGMAQQLYKTERVVRASIDRCAEILAPELGADIRKLLFPPAARRTNGAVELRDTRWAQPALFVVEHALAELWQSWGIRPAAMIGHSVGEYVAATLAGVMTLEDALRLIARRGALISSLPRGAMLSVMAGADALAPHLTKFNGDVSIAAVNSPRLTVLAGTDESIDAVAQALLASSIVSRRLHTSHAFHSAMMNPILQEFETLVSTVTLRRPTTPMLATLTGAVADDDVMRPGYWSAQIRQTVRFADAVRSAREGRVGSPPVFLEVGPGNALSTFVQDAARTDGGGGATCLTSLPSPNEQREELDVMLSSLGAMWSGGTIVDWNGYHRDEPRMRVSLPTYPFERRSYWIGAKQNATVKRETATEVRNTDDWYHVPRWREVERVPRAATAHARKIIVLDDGSGLGEAVAERIRVTGGDPIRVRRGENLQRISDHEVTCNSADAHGTVPLAAMLCDGDAPLAGVIDCWAATPPSVADIDLAARDHLLFPMRLVHALGAHATTRPLPMLLVSRGATRVLPQDVVDPTRALGIGLAKVLPQEHPGLRTCAIDVDDHPTTAALLVDELLANASEPNVALRGGARFVEVYDSTVLPLVDQPQGLPDQPVVLVTGGLGHMGLILSEGLFHALDAKLVLVGRTALPEPDEWAAAAKDPATPDAQRNVLSRLAAMHTERADVMVLRADMNHASEVRRAIDLAIERFGRIDILVHGAARIDAGAFASAADTGESVVEAQLSPKVRGMLHLIDAMRGREPARWVLHSSISTILGGLGLAAYSAANAFIDAVALAGGNGWLSVDWDLWENAAEAQIAGMPSPIQPEEGVDALLRTLGTDVGQRVIVSVNDLGARLKAWVRTADKSGSTDDVERHPRPNLSTAYVAPQTETERELADIWGAQLGVDKVGIHDRFFELGGHSLLAVQLANEIHDRLLVDLPVLKLFQSPTVAALAVVVDQARAGTGDRAPVPLPTVGDTPHADATALEGTAPELATKQSYRDFYDDVTRRLEQTGVAAASFFLNYGYISLGNTDEARVSVSDTVFNSNSVRLAYEVLGSHDLRGKRVLDVGCGRGGTAALIADHFATSVLGVDLSPEAVTFNRRTHRDPNLRFEVGDAEHLPCEAASFDAVTNIESSHTYPNLRAFYGEVARVLAKGGVFLYTDLLPVARWLEVRALLGPLGLTIKTDREITANVLASCDEIAGMRAQAFGGSSATMDNFLAVPGSHVYEQMKSGNWEYRIVRAVRK
jgi:phthiocerol/phenolphthiocerol synthesis type-I polyketide synthase E